MDHNSTLKESGFHENAEFMLLQRATTAYAVRCITTYLLFTH
jgi:hypothetical protein